MRKILMFMFEILQLLRETLWIHTIEYSLSELMACISSIDSSPNLCFFHQFFVELPTINFMPSDICRVNFHLRSNIGIMAGNRETVNQPES